MGINAVLRATAQLTDLHQEALDCRAAQDGTADPDATLTGPKLHPYNDDTGEPEFADELVLFAAEACFKHSLDEEAATTLQRYFATKPIGANAARGMLLRANINADAGDRDGVIGDVSNLLQAVSGCEKVNAALVYNASVLWYRAHERAMAGSFWAELHPTCAAVHAAVHAAQIPDAEWAARIAVVCAKAQFDQSGAATASATLKQLYSAEIPPPARQLAARLQLELNLLPELLIELEAQAAPTAIAKARARVQAEARKAAAGEDVEDFEKAMRGCLSELMQVPGVGNEEAMLVNWDPGADESRRIEALAAVAELGRAVVGHHGAEIVGSELAVGLVQQCSRLCVDASGAQPINLAGQHLQSELDLARLTAASSRSELTKAAVGARMELLLQGTNLLLGSQDADAPALTQAVCCFVWNASLPLLQRNLRHYVRRPFEMAVTALEAIGSELHDLQAAMHVQLSKIAEDDGLLSIMKAHADLAAELDVELNHGPVIAELLNRHASMTAVDNARSEDGVQGAFIWLEKAKETDDVALVRAALCKAGATMAPRLFAQLPRAFPSAAELKLLQSRLDQTGLFAAAAAAAPEFKGTPAKGELDARAWTSIARIARKHRIWDIHYAAAQFVGALSVPPTEGVVAPPEADAANGGEDGAADGREDGGDAANAPDVEGANVPPVAPEAMSSSATTMLRAAAEISIMKGEALIQLLKMHGATLGVPFVPEGFPAGNELDTYTQQVAALATECVQSFVDAAKHGGRIDEPWLAANAAVYLWNYTQHLAEVPRARFLSGPFQQLQVIVGGSMGNPGAGDRLVILNARMCRTIAKAAYAGLADEAESPTGTDTAGALELCSRAITALGTASYGESAALVSIRAAVLRLQGKPIMPAAGEPLAAAIDADASLKSLFLVEGLEDPATGSSTPAQAADAVDALVIAATPGSPGLARLLRMQLLSRVALYCVDAKAVAQARRAAAAIVALSPANAANAASRASRVKPDGTAGLCCCIAHFVLAGTKRAEVAQLPPLERPDCIAAALVSYASAIDLSRQCGSLGMLAAVASDMWNFAVEQSEIACPTSFIKPLLKALAAFAELEGNKAKEPTAAGMRSHMYTIMIETYARNGLWKDALDICDVAFRVMPKATLGSLYCHRTICKSKLGQSIEREVFQLDKEPPAFKSVVWTAVATVAASAGDRLKARQAASAAYASLPGRETDHASGVLDHADWLYRHRHVYPSADVRAVVHDAIGVLNRPEVQARCAELGGSTAGVVTELLAIANAMLSGLADETKEAVAYALAAHSHIVKLWGISIESVNEAAKAAQEETLAADQGKGKGRKSKLGGTPTPDTIDSPVSLDDWVGFDADGVCAALRGSGGGHSVQKLYAAGLTARHAARLAKTLAGFGYSQLCLPSLLLFRATVSDTGCCTSAAAHTVAELELKAWYAGVNLAPSPVGGVRGGETSPGGKSPAKGKKSPAGSKSPTKGKKSPGSRSSSPTGADDDPATRARAPGVIDSAELSKVHIANRKIKQHAGGPGAIAEDWAPGFEPWRWWAVTAQLLLDSSAAGGCRELLAECKVAALLRADTETLGTIALCEAQVQCRLDRPRSALQLLEGVLPAAGTPGYWHRFLALFCDAQTAAAAEPNYAVCSDVLRGFGTVLEAAAVAGGLRRRDQRHLQAALQQQIGQLRCRELAAQPKLDAAAAVAELSGLFRTSLASFLELGDIGMCGQLSLAWVDALNSLRAGCEAGSYDHKAATVAILDVVAECSSAVKPFVDGLLAEQSSAANHPVLTAHCGLVLERSAIQLEVYRAQTWDVVAKFAREKQGPTIEEMIDDYVKLPDAERDPVDVKWDAQLRTAGEALTSTLSALLQSGCLAPGQVARASLILGCALRLAAATLRAECNKGSSKTVWDTVIPVAAAAAAAAGSTTEDSPGADGTSPRASPSPEKRFGDGTPSATPSPQGSPSPSPGGGGPGGDTLAVPGSDAAAAAPPPADPMESVGLCADDLLRQSLTLLDAAIGPFLERGDLASASAAALEVVHALGASAPAESQSTAKYVALHQSCAAACELRGVVRSALRPAAVSSEKAAINTIDTAVAAGQADQAGALWNRLSASSWAARFLSVPKTANAALETIPSAIRSLVLQHSADGKWLYGAVLRDGYGGDMVASARVAVDAGQLAEMQATLREVQALAAAEASKDVEKAPAAPEPVPTAAAAAGGAAPAETKPSSARKGSAAKEKKGSAKGKKAGSAKGRKGSATPSGSAKSRKGSATPSEPELAVPPVPEPAPEPAASEPVLAAARVSEEPEEPAAPTSADLLKRLTEQMEAYLASVLAVLHAAFIDPGAGDTFHAMLLLDQPLMGLPLEAMPVLRDLRISSISRDFSAQMLVNRLAHACPVDADAGGKKKKGSKGAGGVLEDVPVPAAGMTYIVDPAGQFPAEVAAAVAKTCETAQRTLDPKATTAGWVTAAAGAAPPGVPAVQRALESAAVVLHCGPTDLLDGVGRKTVGNANFERCRLAVLLAHVVPVGAAADSPGVSNLQLLALLSARGASGITVNQWKSSALANETRLTLLVPSLTEGLGKGLQRLRAVRPAESAETVSPTKGKPDKGKPDKGKPKKGAAPEPLAGCFDEADLAARFNTVHVGLPNIVVQ